MSLTTKAEATKPTDAPGGQLSAGEFFEAALRRQKAGGDGAAVAGAGGGWEGDEEGEQSSLSDAAKQRVQEKLRQQLEAVEGQVAAAADNRAISSLPAFDLFPSMRAEDRAALQEERRQEGLSAYSALKKDLLLATGAAVAAGTAFCFILFSLQAALSYSLGGAGSCAYLVLLGADVDKLSREDVPAVFKRRLRRTSPRVAAPQEGLQKAVLGSSRALSSPRLVVPAALVGLWAASRHLDGELRLELAPLLLGFFSYKAAALYQAYRDTTELR